MSLAVLYSRAREGVNAPLVTVEVHLANGLPVLSIVGLPEKAVQESKDRVRGALVNSGYAFPARRITVNLAPADLPKEGGRFDLPIAVGILQASGQLAMDSNPQWELVGELALSGEIRQVRGILPLALAVKQAGRQLILPSGNAAEAALVSRLSVLPANHLLEVAAHLSGHESIAPHSHECDPGWQPEIPDLADVRGQAQVKRALEVAAAGRHSLLMIGPPGTGKTMLASRLPALLPAMTEKEALEAAAVRSVSQQGFQSSQWKVRPFRAPHHTASAVALVGGGGNPRPGEISLAHNGVLFLDELPEYDRRVLEALREPLESGRITISRAARQAEFPADFQLVAAMNPCPCGYLGDPRRACGTCTADQLARYRNRVSGPILDRIDIHIEVPALPADALAGARPEGAETSAQVRQRVEQAAARQLQRNGKPNAALTSADIEQSCILDINGHRLLQQAMEKFGLSARAYHRLLKLARTIADLAGADHISTTHLSEAVGYRRLDRKPLS